MTSLVECASERRDRDTLAAVQTDTPATVLAYAQMMAGLGVDELESVADRPPQARWRSLIALALVAIVIVVVGSLVYRERSDTTSASTSQATDAPPATECATTAQPPAIDPEVVSSLLQRLGPVASTKHVDIGCGSYAVQTTMENAEQVYASYSRLPEGPALGPPSTTTDEGVEVWIVSGQVTEAIRTAVARQGDSLAVSIPAPASSVVSSLTDAELVDLAVELLQAAPS